MKTIRLRDMTDDEYRVVTESACPVCGSREHARTNYSNITSRNRSIDVICETCGAAWSVCVDPDKALLEQMYLPDMVCNTTSCRNLALQDLRGMSDNKIKRSVKSTLISIALDLGEDELIDLNKPELAKALIEIRDKDH